MIVIGLTGSIGMGKSVTASMFRAAGLPVHDSDAAVHRLYAGVASPLIEKFFPGTTREGVVDRTLLGERVLMNPGAMRLLESLVHPLVYEDREAFRIAQSQKGARALVLEAPLLFETGYESAVDVIVVVDAEKAVQKQRVLNRHGMTLEKFEAILGWQIPSEDKKRKAHFVVKTDRGTDYAKRQVFSLLRSLASPAES